ALIHAECSTTWGTQENNWLTKGVPTPPTRAVQMPHRTRIRTNTQRAPQRTTVTVLGTSRIQYPQKKMPIPSPTTSSPNPRPPCRGERVHPDRGDGDVDAVEVRQDVEEK